MFRKSLAFLLCVAAVSGCLTSCGKDENSSSDGNTTATTMDAAQNIEIANFTEPQKGDTIIIMKVKDYGEVKFRLFPEYAEKGVENFVELAKKGYYDGLTFHRVIKDFMIQGGDPVGNGTGGESVWGGEFDGGTDPHLIHASGALAYANSGSTATDGSQFYVVTGTICTKDDINYYRQNGMNISPQQEEIYTTVGGTPWLDGGYTVFGQVIDGLDIIFKLQNVATGANDKPNEDVIIESMTVGEYNGEEIHWFMRDYQDIAPTAADVDVMNFTEPEEGETIVTMDIEGYDHPVMFKLFPEYASKGVENFVELAKSGYYDGLRFHRVIKDFMIQGGDPAGNGTGGECIWGGKFDGGTDPHLIHVAGALAYANSGSTSTNGSQFYIVTGEVYSDNEINELINSGYPLSEDQKELYSTVGGTPWLDGNYTVFGQVFEGLDIIFDIQNADTDEYDMPNKDVTIKSVTVQQYAGEDVKFRLSDYEGGTANDAENADDAENSETTEETTAETEAETTASNADSEETETTAE